MSDFRTPEGIEPKIGQRWADQDKRMHGKVITVSELIGHGDGRFSVEYLTGGKCPRMIRGDRLRMPFWKLVTTTDAGGRDDG